MKNIRLVASDLDGTLFNTKKEITPRLHRALVQLHAQGICFVPATGRPLSTVPQSIKQLPFLRYIITSNGAAIYDAVCKKNIVENCLSTEAVDTVLPIAKNLPVITEYFIHGKAFIAKDTYENLARYPLTEGHRRYILETRTPVACFWDAMQENRASLENINLIFSDFSLREEIRAKLRAYPFCSVTDSTEKNLEITSPLATKAMALETLCSRLHIEQVSVLALGDGENDIPMLQFAGIGVAMANGGAQIKKEADLIAEDCDAFGAAKILEQILAARSKNP